MEKNTLVICIELPTTKPKDGPGVLHGKIMEAIKKVDPAFENHRRSTSYWKSYEEMNN